MMNLSVSISSLNKSCLFEFWDKHLNLYLSTLSVGSPVTEIIIYISSYHEMQGSQITKWKNNQIFYKKRKCLQNDEIPWNSQEL